jgi:hypothetical protein
VAVGDYEQIENDRRRAWKQMMRSSWGSEERKELERHHDALAERRVAYLRDLLARLPFRWHIAHAYTAQETANYGGADHIVVDEPIRIGRLVREPGDALSRSRRKFLALYEVEEGRLPTSHVDIKIAERIVTPPSAKKKPKTGKQLDQEIAEAIRR